MIHHHTQIIRLLPTKPRLRERKCIPLIIGSVTLSTQTQFLSIPRWNWAPCLRAQQFTSTKIVQHDTCRSNQSRCSTVPVSTISTTQLYLIRWLFCQNIFYVNGAIGRICLGIHIHLGRIKKSQSTQISHRSLNITSRKNIARLSSHLTLNYAI